MTFPEKGHKRFGWVHVTAERAFLRKTLHKVYGVLSAHQYNSWIHNMKPISSRDRLTVYQVASLGGLLTVLTWWIYGVVAGSVVTALVALLFWRALNTGFILDARGLTLRAFVPGQDRLIPWSELRSVDVDTILIRSNEGSGKQLRIRFFVERGEAPQLLGSSKRVADAVLSCFEGRGLPATDTRDKA